MNTFLPFPSFTLSAQCLDNKRLGKQRVESMQMIQANQKLLAYQLQYGKYEIPYRVGWLNHPCTVMWRNYDHMLALYSLACVREWRSRGFQDSTESFFYSVLDSTEYLIPPWISDPEELHKINNSHQAMLFKKDPIHYKQFSDAVATDYYWPRYSIPSSRILLPL